MKRALTCLAAIAAPALASFGTACDGETTTPETENPTLVEAGKADNFLSTSAQEYWLEGTDRVTLDASWANRTEAQQLAEVKRLIPYRQVLIGWFLNRYLVDKDEKEPDAAYGGFKALTKNGSYEELNVRRVEGLTWAFDFRQEVAGQMELVDAIPDATPNADGTWSFQLWIGKVSNADIVRLDTDREWYRSAPWGSFTPDSVSADRKEQLPLTIRAQVAEDDAWIDLARLFEDGKLTVGVHYGWDYHNKYHEVHSKSLYSWLTTRKGFKSPVDSWEQLTHDAGPLKGSVTYGGRKIDVELSLFWGRSGDATDPDTAAGGRQLEADMLESLAEREIVIFNGHSGPFYGFALANWRMTSEGDLDDSELAAVALKTGAYQIIVAEGCDTYAIGQAFWDNPFKPGLVDLDVLTTTSFSNAGSGATVTDFLSVVLGAPGSSTAAPTRYTTLLDEMDGNSPWFNTMYGVHGIDDNPRLHPFADRAKFCASCSKASDCGAGMYCVTMSDGTKGCAAECASTDACGAGYACRNTRIQTSLSMAVCAPVAMSCRRSAPAVALPVINEMMPTPTVDYNGDGRVHATEDEYVELGNAGAAPLDLSGWTLADGVSTRHVFPSGTIVPPGGALVVFGGGTVTLRAGTTIMQVAKAKTLALNKDGDKVVLSDLDGRAVARAEYRSAVAPGKSWTRARDLAGDVGFEVVGATPGVKRDGSQF
jgi:hypothetical protein